MYSAKDSDTVEYAVITTEQQLLLDGTVHMEEFEDVSIPRVKGLIELISDYFSD